MKKSKKNLSKLPAVKKVFKMAAEGKATDEEATKALCDAISELEEETKRGLPMKGNEEVDKVKADAVVGRIIDAMSENKVKALTVNDARLRALKGQLDIAEENMQVLTQNVIKRQMAARLKEILANEALKLIPELTHSGDIVYFLSDEDRERFNKVRGKIFLISDVLDGALLDFTSVIRSSGLYGHCQPLEAITACRKAIEKWATETVPVMHLPTVKPVVLEECDRIGEYIDKRIEVLQRKTTRIVERECKEEEKEKATV